MSLFFNIICVHTCFGPHQKFFDIWILVCFEIWRNRRGITRTRSNSGWTGVVWMLWGVHFYVFFKEIFIFRLNRKELSFCWKHFNTFLEMFRDLGWKNLLFFIIDDVAGFELQQLLILFWNGFAIIWDFWMFL